MDMGTLQAAVTNLGISGVTAYSGYAATDAKPPYAVIRPMVSLPEDLALAGNAVGWDNQQGIYCVGGSVEAANYIAKAVANGLQGARVGGYVVSCSIGYSGRLIEGLYESQVTVQANQGEL